MSRGHATGASAQVLIAIAFALCLGSCVQLANAQATSFSVIQHPATIIDANFPFDDDIVLHILDAGLNRIETGADSSLEVTVTLHDAAGGGEIEEGVCPSSRTVTAVDGVVTWDGAACTDWPLATLHFDATGTGGAITVATQNFEITNEIQLGFMVPVTGVWSWVGGSMDTITKVAEDDLNSGYSFWGKLLSNRNVRVLHGDSASQSLVGMERTLEMIRTSRLRALVGPAVDNTAIIISQVCSAIGLVQLSYLADAQELSNKSIYPYFSRVFRGAESEYIAMAKLIANYGWTTVALISAVPFPVPIAFYEWCKRLGISILTEVSVPTLTGQEDISKQMQIVKDSGARVIIPTIEDSSALGNVVVAALDAGITPSDGYQWFSSTFVAGSAPLYNQYPPDGRCMQRDPPCTVRFRGWQMIVQLMGDPINDPGGLYKDMFVKWLSKDYRINFGEYNFPSSNVVAFLGLTYDALALLVKALDAMIGAEEVVRPARFTEVLRATTHTGLTGDIELDPATGDRLGFQALLGEMQTSDERTVNEVSSLDITAVIQMQTKEGPVGQVDLLPFVWSDSSARHQRKYLALTGAGLDFVDAELGTDFRCNRGCGGGLDASDTRPYVPGQCAVYKYLARNADNVVVPAIGGAIQAVATRQFEPTLTAAATAQSQALAAADITAEITAAITAQATTEFTEFLTSAVEAQVTAAITAGVTADIGAAITLGVTDDFGDALTAELNVQVAARAAELLAANDPPAQAACDPDATAADCQTLVIPQTTIGAACANVIADDTATPTTACNDIVVPLTATAVACGAAGETATTADCQAILTPLYPADSTATLCGVDGSLGATAPCQGPILPTIEAWTPCSGLILDDTSDPTDACTAYVVPNLDVVAQCGPAGETATSPGCLDLVLPLVDAQSTTTLCGVDGSLAAEPACVAKVLPRIEAFASCGALMTGAASLPDANCTAYVTPLLPVIQACGAAGETATSAACAGEIGADLLAEVAPALIAQSTAEFPAALTTAVGQEEVAVMLAAFAAGGTTATDTAAVCGVDPGSATMFSPACQEVLLPQTAVGAACGALIADPTGTPSDACTAYVTPLLPVMQACGGATASTVYAPGCLALLRTHLNANLQGVLAKLEAGTFTAADYAAYASSNYFFTPWALLCGADGSYLYGALCMRLAAPFCRAVPPAHHYANGVCVGQDRCQCRTMTAEEGGDPATDKAFIGATCEVPQCTMSCGHGDCVSPNVCSCHAGWRTAAAAGSPQCMQPICVPACDAAGGTCQGNLRAAPGVSGVLANGCDCANDYFHDRLRQALTCSVKCPCNLAGTQVAAASGRLCDVDYGTCECKDGWSGAHCETEDVFPVWTIALMVIGAGLLAAAALLGYRFQKAQALRQARANMDWKLTFDEDVRVLKGAVGFNSRMNHSKLSSRMGSKAASSVGGGSRVAGSRMTQASRMGGGPSKKKKQQQQQQQQQADAAAAGGSFRAEPTLGTTVEGEAVQTPALGNEGMVVGRYSVASVKPRASVMENHRKTSRSHHHGPPGKKMSLSAAGAPAFGSKGSLEGIQKLASELSGSTGGSQGALMGDSGSRGNRRNSKRQPRPSASVRASDVASTLKKVKSHNELHGSSTLSGKKDGGAAQADDRVSVGGKSARSAGGGSLGGMEQMFCELGIVHNTRAAIKKLDRDTVPESESLLVDMRAMRDTRHTNIVMFIGASLEAPDVCLCTEYAGKGSLADVLENQDVPLDWDFRYSLARDIATGMEFLQKSKIGSHGNLKSSNCLIDDRWVVKLTDFGIHEMRTGLHAQYDDDYKRFYGMLWVAPELLDGLRHYLDVCAGTPTGDVYSYGVILFEMAQRSAPYADLEQEPEQLVEGIRAGKLRLEATQDVQAEQPKYVELMGTCQHKDPAERPTFSAIISTIKRLSPKSGSLVDNMLKMMEKYTSNLEGLVSERTEELVVEKEKAENLLYQMLPAAVAKELAVGNAVTAESFDQCTIYFSDIVGWTKISARSTPLQVVDLLNALYTTFDAIIDEHEVYKVETIGDAYMVVSGIPDRNGDQHACEIANMSLDLLASMTDFRITHLPGEHLFLRVGMHSGPCVAGVVGLKMPRYCLFGDTVNTASRMESGGLAWRIHMSPQAQKILEKHGGYKLECRGEIEVKGKGRISTYWLWGRDGFTAELPDISLAPSAAETETK